MRGKHGRTAIGGLILGRIQNTASGYARRYTLTGQRKRDYKTACNGGKRKRQATINH